MISDEELNLWNDDAAIVINYGENPQGVQFSGRIRTLISDLRQARAALKVYEKYLVAASHLKVGGAEIRRIIATHKPKYDAAPGLDQKGEK